MIACPECNEPYTDDKIGVWTCVQCKSRICKSTEHKEIRLVPEEIKPKPVSHKLRRSEINYPFEVINGSAFYRCIQCTGLIPLTSRMDVHSRKLANGNVELNSAVETSSVTVGFRRGEPDVTHFKASDGSMMIKAHFVPIIKSGPVCEGCK